MEYAFTGSGVNVQGSDTERNLDVTHIPVMVDEICEILNPQKGKTYIDCTLGLGGHAKIFLEAGANIVGIDQDEDLLRLTAQRFSADIKKNRLICIHDNFRNIREIVERIRIKEDVFTLAEGVPLSVAGIIYDLGICSYQLAIPGRGFSFQSDGPLDMRMNKQGKIRASDLVNTLSYDKLSGLIREYGEERFARRIARGIIRRREGKGNFTNTLELVDAIQHALPYKYSKIHFATRTFQALRIATNDELESLKFSLKDAISILNEGGKILVISFHSLEDRIVKETIKGWKTEKMVKVLTPKPIRPSLEELKNNPRARSAKLRAAQKIA